MNPVTSPVAPIPSVVRLDPSESFLSLDLLIRIQQVRKGINK